jgi:hypothetical protein
MGDRVQESAAVRRKLWKLLSTFIARQPKLINWIIRTAQRTPYFHLTGYMDRWWLMPRWALAPDENGNLFPKAWCPFSIRIHHIKRPDDGRDLHDHPFDYRTIILRGWYDECDVFGRSNIRSAGDTVAARAQTFHRIAAMPAGGVWTLFIMGPRINRWGFLVGGRKVYYKHYLKLED